MELITISEVVKPVGGAMIGVAIPIVADYALKGGRLGATEEEPGKGFKWSGILGLGLGLVETGLAWAGSTGRIGWPKEKEDVGLVAAMGGASLATGASILILDELRKTAAWAWKRGEVPYEVALRREGLEIPPEELIKEI